MKEKENRPLNLVFLGCGSITRQHSRTLRKFRDRIQLYYASRSIDKARFYNKKYRGSGYFKSYETAIKDPQTDIILIATPPAYHLDLALQALENNKQVIVEKPPFLYSKDFDIIRKAQTESGCRVFVAENYFYKPLACKLREIIRADLIGEILFININALKLQRTDDWRDNKNLSGGGALFEGGIHWINFIANIGLKVKTACGFRPGRDTDLDRSMLVSFEFENAVGSLNYSWEIPVLFKGLQISKIYGRKGTITFESNGLFVFVHGIKKRLFIPKLTDISGYRAMFQDFIHSIKSGEEANMNLEIAQRDLEILESIYQSQLA